MSYKCYNFKVKMKLMSYHNNIIVHEAKYRSMHDNTVLAFRDILWLTSGVRFQLYYTSKEYI
jgi:hypothetical protein